MRRALLVAIACASALLAFSLTNVDEAGFQKLVQAHRGKVILYDFWATWCDSCRAELPQLVKLETRLRSRGFELVTISADEPEAVADAEKLLRRFAVAGLAYRRQAKNDDRFINAIDPEWSGALPAGFLYDRKGRRVRSFIGETDMKVFEVEISKLL
ncbi:MAG: TlpA family protein disulfide reductase [Acidobacteriota bacterium]|nr:TlpA family protein disulfide reductase [Acidobacteriota bacterium]